MSSAIDRLRSAFHREGKLSPRNEIPELHLQFRRFLQARGDILRLRDNDPYEEGMFLRDRGNVVTVTRNKAVYSWHSNPDFDLRLDDGTTKRCRVAMYTSDFDPESGSELRPVIPATVTLSISIMVDGELVPTFVMDGKTDRVGFFTGNINRMLRVEKSVFERFRSIAAQLPELSNS